MDLQAMARVHRIGQEKTVHVSPLERLIGVEFACTVVAVSLT